MREAKKEQAVNTDNTWPTPDQQQNPPRTLVSIEFTDGNKYRFVADEHMPIAETLRSLIDDKFFVGYQLLGDDSDPENVVIYYDTSGPITIVPMTSVMSMAIWPGTVYFENRTKR